MFGDYGVGKVGLHPLSCLKYSWASDLSSHLSGISDRSGRVACVIYSEETTHFLPGGILEAELESASSKKPI